MAIKTSKAVTGNWDAGGSWVGDVAPVLGTDTTVIAANAVITYNLSSTTQQLDCTVNGTLQFSTSMDTKMVMGNASITIASGGRLRIGGNDPIDPALIKTAELLFNPSADNSKGLAIQAGGALELLGDARLYGSDYDTTIADYCQVTGTLTPDVTGMYFVDGTQGGKTKYKRNGLVSGTQYYIWWTADQSVWVLNATPGEYANTLRWVGSATLNSASYGPLGGATGTATVSNGWTPSATSKTFTVNGAFATKWAVGQELLIHKNPAVYGNYNTDFAPASTGPATIAAIAQNVVDATLTDITINETYAPTYFKDGLVLNLARNIKLGKYGAATLIGQAALTNRPLLTDANTVAGNVNISNAILTGFYRPGGTTNSTGQGATLNKAVIRHCDIGWFNGTRLTMDAIVYGCGNCLLAGINLSTVDGYFCNTVQAMFGANANANTKNIINVTMFGVGSGLGVIDSSIINGDLFANVVAISGTVVNCEIYSRIYANTTGYFCSLCSNFYGSLGWNPQGNLQINTNDIAWNFLPAFKTVFRSAKLPSGGLTYYFRNSVSRAFSGQYNFENYNQTIGDHRIIDAYGDLIKNTTAGNLRTGGASSVIEVIPQSNCSIPLPLQILDWKESDVPASQQTRSVFMRGGGSSGWVTFPTAAQLWLEAEYLDSASAWTTAVIKSTAVLTDNTTWTEFPLIFTPARQGVVRYRAYLATYAAGMKAYVDNQLNRLNDSTLLGVWADGASQLQEQTDMFTDSDRTKLDTVISTMALNSTVAKEATLSAGVSSILEATPEVDLTAITNYLDGTTPIAAGSLENVAVSVLPTQTFIQDQTTTSGSLRVKQYSEFLWAQVITDAVGTPVDLTNKDLVLTFYKPNDPNKIPVYRVTTNDTLQKSGNTISLPLLRELTGVARTLHGMLWENDSETVPLYVMELIIEPTVDPEATVPSA